MGAGHIKRFRMSTLVHSQDRDESRLSSLRCLGNGFDSPEDFARLFRGMVTEMHKSSAIAPIRFPDSPGAFPGDVLLCPPPVVVDANVLRNDIRRACRTGQRTVLVTAANAGLLRLFCAEHVYQEVIEHSGDWTAGGPVSRDAFLRRWLLEYLPLIRVVPLGEGHLACLGPAELARIVISPSLIRIPTTCPRRCWPFCWKRSSCPRTAGPSARSTATQTCPGIGNG